ncbi:flagellar motor switch protein FliN [Breznakiella homolactica]|uniref:Flagellar motor switch protein FliN n=1 Tax=Breznakiella homolactica TaxID=2798577 RepID=A0A7T7XL70_9SPIR|nr:flagellar motor switch protein FliN [Breznakiella homolactica]QQO08248.1 flagellar motor switch protein FliN [Breznakiella homolactica]
MSDGALSQDEIDALLAGVDSSSLGGSPGAAPASPQGGADKNRLEEFLSSTVNVLSSNLAMMTGAQVSLSGPSVDSADRESFLQKLPDTVTVVKADFTSGFPGDHMFIMGEETAKKIAALMNKEENIELDEMALSVIGEVVSQITGTQITSLTDKTGNKNIAAMSPEAANVPKAVAALPGGSFMAATYQMDLGDGGTVPLWEIYGSSVASDIASALGGGAQAAAMPDMGSSFGGMDMGGMNMGSMNMGGMPAMGGMNMGGMPIMGGQPSNVQSVQFPGLTQQQATPQEQGNIGLIMDVFMEMTVELGRTKKLIKEILGMGEGTIIELDKLAGEPVDILVNHKLIAKGEVVVIDENFGVRVTEIVSPMERMTEMG